MFTGLPLQVFFKRMLVFLQVDLLKLSRQAGIFSAHGSLYFMGFVDIDRRQVLLDNLPFTDLSRLALLFTLLLLPQVFSLQ